MLSFFVSRSLVFRVSLGVFGTAIYVNRNKLTMIIPGCLNILAFIGLTRNTICQETRIFGSRSMWCRHLEEKKYINKNINGSKDQNLRCHFSLTCIYLGSLRPCNTVVVPYPRE